MDKKKILIIDDDRVLVEIMTIRLESQNYEIIVAHDGQQGMLKAKEEEPHLIILDLMLPKMDGFKVCGLLKSDTRYNHIPIIMFTAKILDEDVKLGEELGAEAYLTKPFEPEILLNKINTLLET